MIYYTVNRKCTFPKGIHLQHMLQSQFISFKFVIIITVTFYFFLLKNIVNWWHFYPESFMFIKNYKRQKMRNSSFLTKKMLIKIHHKRETFQVFSTRVWLWLTVTISMQISPCFSPLLAKLTKASQKMNLLFLICTTPQHT